MWFIGVEVEQETSAPPPPLPLKKILDTPLILANTVIVSEALKFTKLVEKSVTYYL